MDILGVDIGGSGIKGAPVDIDKGNLLQERHRIDTPQPATPEAVSDTVAAVIDFFSWKGAVGCGFPAVVKKEIALTAANIDDAWIGLNVADLISKKTKRKNIGITTIVENEDIQEDLKLLSLLKV